jgi:hypothetical protein
MVFYTVLELSCPFVRVSSCDFVDRGYVRQVERSTKSHELTRIETDNTSTF